MKQITIKKSLTLCALSVFYFLPSSANAETIWPLSKILKLADESSLDLKAGNQEILRAEYQAIQAGRWSNPYVSLSAGTYNIQPDKGRAFNVMVTQEVPLFGQKSIAKSIGQQEVEVSKAGLEVTKLFFHHQVVKLSYELVSANALFTQINHRREGLDVISQYLKRRIFASPAQVVERNLIENRLRSIDEQQILISSKRSQAWEALNVYLHLDSQIIPEVSSKDKMSIPDHDSLLKRALESNPEITQQKNVIETSNLRVTQAGKRAYPDVSLGGGYYHQSVVTDQERSLVGILNFSLPLWDQGGPAVNAAKAQVTGEQLRLNKKSREIESQFSQAWARLQEASQKTELYPVELIDKLEKQMSVAERDWKKGLVSVPALLELESQVHEQAFKAHESQAEYAENLSYVLSLAGLKFEPIDAPSSTQSIDSEKN